MITVLRELFRLLLSSSLPSPVGDFVAPKDNILSIILSIVIKKEGFNSLQSHVAGVL